MLKLDTETIINIPTIKKAYLNNNIVYKKYIKLDYIEATGTQYIDTGVTLGINRGVECEIAYDEFSNTSRWGASYGGTADTPRRFAFGTQDTAYYFICGGSTLSLGTVDNNKHTIKAFINNGTLTYSIDSITQTTSVTATACNLSFFLFARHTNQGVQHYVKCKIYSCKLYDNETLVRDFIPVLDSDNNVCLYDKISDKFFYNKGTGDFIAGPKKLDYIESTGTQYIKTGVYVDSNVDVELSCQITAKGTQHLFGVGTNGKRYLLAQQSSNNRIIFDYNTSNVRIISTIVGYTSGSHILKVINKEFFIDNVSYGVSSGATYTNPTEARIFGSDNGNGHMKLYYCKIYNNDILVRDFIPVLDTNNIACLYDRISETFFYNQGTGDFLYE